VRIGIGIPWHQSGRGRVGTHGLTIGDGGSARGFFASVFGAIVPATFAGLGIEYLQANAAGTVLFELAGAVQIPGVETINISATGATVACVWNPSFGDYRASGRVDIWEWMGANIGATVQIDIVAA